MTAWAMPSSVECGEAARAGNLLICGGLCCNWSRFGPMACLPLTAWMPSARRAAAISSVSARKAARPPGLALLPALATSSDETRSG